MTITGDTGGMKERAVKRRYPVVEGTTAATTKQEGTELNLQIQESSLVSEKDKIGIN